MRSKIKKDKNTKVLHPEQRASFISQVTTGWANRLLYTGYKKSLQASDLWPLRSGDSCENQGLLFDAVWSKKLHSLDASQKFEKNKGADSNEDGTIHLKAPPQVPPRFMLCWTLVNVYKWPVLKSAFIKLVGVILSSLSPIIFRRLLQFIESDEASWIGFCIVAFLSLNSLISTLLLQRQFHIVGSVGINIRSCLMDAVYRKTLLLDSESRAKTTSGEVVNLMSIDAQHFSEFMIRINMIWSSPLQIIIALILLYHTIGISALAGIFVMLVTIPINALIAGKLRKFQVGKLKCKDQRTKVISEVLNAVKFIKMYAWEQPFIKKIGHIRKKELHFMKMAGIAQAFSMFFWICNPFLVSISSFGMFVLLGNELTPEVAFVAIALFNMLGYPMSLLPQVITGLVQTYVSHNRIQKFLILSEKGPYSVNDTSKIDLALQIENGSFQWTHGDQGFHLSSISLSVPLQSLTMIVGSVGSGKTSLLNAICGEMHKTSGTIHVKGPIAYVGQQAWIRNASIKENILFGNEFDEKKYLKTLHDCALVSDLKLFQNGDLTEIGAKGINVSGGQKARIAIARAVYADEDIYLLDDPIAALDAHVGKHLFDKVLGPNGTLKNKTRIIVTNAVHFLSQCDQIVALDRGSIAEIGTYQELSNAIGYFKEHVTNVSQEECNHSTVLEKIHLEPQYPALKKHRSEVVLKASPASSWASNLNLIFPYAEYSLENIFEDIEGFKATLNKPSCLISKSISTSALLNKPDREDYLKKSSENVGLEPNKETNEVQKGTNNGDDSQSLHKEQNKDDEKLGRLTEDERLASGKVSLHVYMKYFKSIGCILSLLVITSMIFNNAAAGINYYFLTFWTDATKEFLKQTELNITASPIDNAYYLEIYGLIGLIYGSFVLVESAMVVFATVSASKHLHKAFLFGVLRCPMSFFDKTPTGRIINRFSRDINAVDSILPSVMKAFLQCLLALLLTATLISIITPKILLVLIPLVVIYTIILRFYVSTSRQLQRIDSIARSPINSNLCETIEGLQVIRAHGLQNQFIKHNRCLVSELARCTYPTIVISRWLAVRLETLGVIVVAFAATFAILSRDSLSSSLVGLSVSSALAVTKTLNFLVRMFSLVENNIVAVERINEYIDSIPEAEWENKKTAPPQDWPNHGKIEFKNASMRYKPELPFVLKQLSFDIHPAEKIGIAGRTGAGKSSLTLALFRIVELSEGQILIDGIDISTIGLHDLRSKLTIIPQDPIVFSGSIRENLDPFNESTDNAVWEALENVNLAEFVRSLPGNLSYICSEEGNNLGIGQRQLINLARALLRKPKILILDEATAAIDLATDEFIQTSIRKEFSQCTTLTIAHRVNTILDSNRIVILANGEIKELDTPTNLIQSEGYFYSILKEMNLLPKTLQ